MGPLGLGRRQPRRAMVSTEFDRLSRINSSTDVYSEISLHSNPPSMGSEVQPTAELTSSDDNSQPVSLEP